DDLQAHGAVFALDGLELTHDLLARVAEEDVKDDSRHDVALPIAHRVRPAAVDALQPAQPAPTRAAFVAGEDRDVAVHVSDHGHPVVVQVGDDDVTRFTWQRRLPALRDLDEQI